MSRWSLLVWFLFICYLGNCIWSVYNLYVLPPCLSKCISSYLKRNREFKLHLYQSPFDDIQRTDAMVLIDIWERNFDHRTTQEKTLKVKLLPCVHKNGSVFLHVFLAPAQETSNSAQYLTRNPFVIAASGSLTQHMVPEAGALNLLSNNDATVVSVKPGYSWVHWRQRLLIDVVHENINLPRSGLPRELFRFLKLTPQGDYLPPVQVDVLSSRLHDLVAINATDTELTLTIQCSAASFGKLRLWWQLEMALISMTSLGFSLKDIDEVKGVFTGTNLYLLCTTFVVAAVHLMLDVLAFKNDVSFWRQRTTTVGLSIRTVIWRCISQLIIFFYLLDEQTSLLVVIPCGIGAVIELWKVSRAFKLEFRWQGYTPTVSFGTFNKAERETEEHDAQVMKRLSYVLYPLCAAGAIYSLLYMPHRSWRSWCIQSLVNGVYAFGFLFMLPQLFVNYKLKSVAHLPWRAFTYKAFNTFIDDIFAFIITMPTAHRVACFRDDIVFLVYLYQRWLYPVDKSRMNEFGDSFDESQEKKKN